jgi:hypothetical protein
MKQRPVSTITAAEAEKVSVISICLSVHKTDFV